MEEKKEKLARFCDIVKNCWKYVLLDFLSSLAKISYIDFVKMNLNRAGSDFGLDSELGLNPGPGFIFSHTAINILGPVRTGKAG